MKLLIKNVSLIFRLLKNNGEVYEDQQYKVDFDEIEVGGSFEQDIDNNKLEVNY